jgi:hypothetical protein
MSKNKIKSTILPKINEVEIVFDTSHNILSIDVGMNNLALYIESIDTDKLSNIVDSLPKKRAKLATRYDKNGEPNPDMACELNKIFTLGQKVWLDKVNITSDTDKFIGTKRKRRLVDNNMLNRLTNYLDSNKQLFSTVDTVIIEQQLKTNPSAQQLQYHIRSWFLINWPTKTFYCFPSKNKTQVLGCYKKLANKSGVLTKITKTQRKNWAKDKAKYILTLRGDESTLEYIFKTNKSKADDLSDCICQCQAFIYLKYICKYEFN